MSRVSRECREYRERECVESIERERESIEREYREREREYRESIEREREREYRERECVSRVSRERERVSWSFAVGYESLLLFVFCFGFLSFCVVFCRFFYAFSGAQLIRSGDQRQSLHCRWVALPAPCETTGGVELPPEDPLWFARQKMTSLQRHMAKSTFNGFGQCTSHAFKCWRGRCCFRICLEIARCNFISSRVARMDG